WGWRLGLEGAGGPRAAFIGRRGALGVRARAGNHGVGFAGDRGRFPLRGRATREEEDGPGAWGRAGSGKGETRVLAERASSADRWARGRLLASARVSGGKAGARWQAGPATRRCERAVRA